MSNFEELFDQSYTRVMGNGAYRPEFVARFYEIFLGKSPTIEAHFANTDMSAQKTMLHDSLHTMVAFYRDKQLTPQLRRLAAMHGRSKHNIPAETYALWLESLVAAAAEFDAEFDRDTELAWRLVMAPGICYMQFCYDR